MPLRSNKTFRLVLIVLSMFVGLLLPIFHHHDGTGRQVRYELVRLKDESVQEERLFDAGAPVDDADLHQQQGAGKNTVWKRHEDISKKYHVLLTSQSSKYLNWQSLLMYYHYKKQKQAGGDKTDVGGFTRLVAASTTSDDISDTVPSEFVNEIDPAKVRDEYKGYVVLNRPYSLQNFFQLGLHEQLDEDFVFIAETDHVFMRPIENLATAKTPVAYPFSYMKQMPKELLKMVRSVCPSIKRISQVQPIGPSPSIIHKAMLKRIIPEWYRISIELKTHQDQYGDKLGWILEMYAFAISAACLDIKFKVLEEFQVEPTAATPCSSKDLESNFIFHYTYPLEFDESGEPMPPNEVGYWSLNKRNYGAAYPPRNLELPPAGSSDCAFYLTRAWTDAINNQSQGVWHQAPVTLGTIGWKPKPLALVDMEKRGLSDLLGSRWTWVHEKDTEGLRNSRGVLVFQDGGTLENPWGKGTWGEITVLPEIISVEWHCPPRHPILSLTFGNAVHVICMNVERGVLKSIRIPDGVLNMGAKVSG
ncbi:hypothetical protein HOP50_02g11720 [Chloropicon primus]|uniref:Hydroxyproline O-arabinosyltransferase-like domain-containing protein n=1 Tax=Chloropicon primus TaxID=1764295 RepID=A0A5B8ME13_9CHLO|nr:hypothetical protein A3770_02p11870 [Chloropicon primus]UPQ97877.1 hypothetical protein HOP50_02g11720 [Chloropicon primus]|eukprot:QDZ18669.1 hypothetical protein A3770_02p11870 [Chloropicon primus]